MSESVEQIIALFDHEHTNNSPSCECEKYYFECGPSKQEFSENNIEGVSEVDMNVRLLESYLFDKDYDSGDKTNYLGLFNSLSVDDQRKVWEHSCFHYGAYGHNSDDINFFWQKREKKSA